MQLICTASSGLFCKWDSVTAISFYGMFLLAILQVLLLLDSCSTLVLLLELYAAFTSCSSKLSHGLVINVALICNMASVLQGQKNRGFAEGIT